MYLVFQFICMSPTKTKGALRQPRPPTFLAARHAVDQAAKAEQAEAQEGPLEGLVVIPRPGSLWAGPKKTSNMTDNVYLHTRYLSHCVHM